jgi:DNA polymerase-1
MSKLVLIDSMAILHRAYHALPPLTTRVGEPIGAIYGLTSMLLRIIQDLRPTHIAFCFDEEAPTFRKKEFKEYQSQRVPTPDELSSQFEKARDFAKAVGIPAYSVPGYEADDIIGTISKEASKRDFDEIVIVTGDRDILQLVDDGKKVALYMPIKGLSSAKLFGERETKERLGVSPKLIPDYKGLVGDASDNYKGVTGIGPKTAVNLLVEFGSFEGIYKNLDKVPERTRTKLRSDKKSAEMSFKLAKIVKDVPVKFDFDDMKKWKIDSNNLLGLFEEYGFRTLTKRVKEVGKQLVDENQTMLF